MIYDLKYCVNSVQADLELPEGKQYLRLLKFAIDAFRRLNLAGQLPTIKTETLEVDKATNTVIIPQDYVSYTKIGICCNGYFINFDIADNLCLQAPGQPTACACDDEIAETITKCCEGGEGWAGDNVASWYYPYYSHVHNNQFVAGFYGMGAGFRHGGYKINLEAGIIQFDSCVRADEVVLEYVSTGIGGDGNATIPQGAIGAICARIHEMNCLLSRDPMVRQNSSTWNRKWVAESSAFVKRNNALNYTEWLTLFRDLTYATPKR